MDFIPHDKKSIAEMLDVIGVSDIEQLFQDIPKDIKLKELKIPSGLSEPDLIENIKETAEKNRVFPHSFMGAGCYYHYIPSLVDFIINRSEFYTSYTPYQAEASQGFLQAIYEYQTIIAKLTGMDVANASMYDGSTALAEAIIMATIITRKNNVLVINELHPEYKEVIRTYCWGQNIQINFSNLETYEGEITSELGAVIFQSPNFFGELENIPEIVKKVRTNNPKCLIIQVMTDPTCLGVLKSPGTNEIDIFIAEGQSFGISPSFGGPGLGIFTTKQKYLRKIPGRLVGKTKELHGDKEGFILTLQAREQHIRREKASSNICTNQALCALSALIYLLSLGEVGLREVAKQNIQKALSIIPIRVRVFPGILFQ